MNILNAKNFITTNDFREICTKLYGTSNEIFEQAKSRYLSAIEKFEKIYSTNSNPEDNQTKDIHIFSASGRTELGGNHTDHQHGCVLAAAVNLDAIGVVNFHNDKVIRVTSEGFESFSVKKNLLTSADKTTLPPVRNGYKTVAGRDIAPNN